MRGSSKSTNRFGRSRVGHGSGEHAGSKGSTGFVYQADARSATRCASGVDEREAATLGNQAWETPSVGLEIFSDAFWGCFTENAAASGWRRTAPLSLTITRCCFGRGLRVRRVSARQMPPVPALSGVGGNCVVRPKVVAERCCEKIVASEDASHVGLVCSSGSTSKTQVLWTTRADPSRRSATRLSRDESRNGTVLPQLRRKASAHRWRRRGREGRRCRGLGRCESTRSSSRCPRCSRSHRGRTGCTEPCRSIAR
jgi:hypothetical protein